MKSLWLKVLGGIAGVILIAVLSIIVYGKVTASSDGVPKAITSQLTSALIMPDTSTTTIDETSYKYDPSSKLFSYTAVYADSHLVFSEQPAPESFTDIPEAYQKVLESMNNYSSFDSTIGTVHLTKPPNSAGKQTAVLNAKGTLLFAKSDRNLDSDQWRALFKSVDVVK